MLLSVSRLKMEKQCSLDDHLRGSKGNKKKKAMYMNKEGVEEATSSESRGSSPSERLVNDKSSTFTSFACSPVENTAAKVNSL